MRIGLATIVDGRRDHLRRQALAVRRLGVERYVIVAMDQRSVDVSGALVDRVSCDERSDQGLPLSAARNRAVERLHDCDLAILLDVDCIPGPQLLRRYRAAARHLDGTAAMLCGPVAYLDTLHPTAVGPTVEQRRIARTRVIRDFPRRGLRRERRMELFWSLSYAIAPRVHQRLGGFDEAYVGYGAEDTDYGRRAEAAGVGLWFVAGAWAYHQHHPPSAPARLAEVVANARRFYARWGSWPMPDVLERAAREQRIRWEPDRGVCELLADGGRRDEAQLRTSFL